MALSEIKFMGLTVRGFKSNIGMGRNQISTLTLDLVQDVAAGDIPQPVPDGFPCYFDFAGYSFYGLLQRFCIKKDVSGFPTYEATLVDPREILEGAEIIIGQYIGTVGSLPNVINAYGYWENTAGYGSSGATDETGMPWNKIVRALQNTINNPFGNIYGGALNFRGIRYGIDLSGMPSVPSYYNIGGGTNIGLLEAIAQVCEDCGCDFYVFLDGFNIRIKTISRVKQPPLGTITSLVNAGFGNTLIRSESATEVRNETTSSFLVGGAVTQLFQNTSDAAASFWGYDTNSNPILGVPDTFNITSPNGKILYSVSCEFMALNAKGIEDIIGTDTYNCSTLELLFAKYSHDSWVAFIRSQRPDIAKFIISPFAPLPGFINGQKPLKPQIVDDGLQMALNLAKGQVNNPLFLKDARLYEFVKGYADEFLGKKFVVRIPFVLAKQDPTTLKISFSQEITDAGWQEEGTQPLGLSEINEDVFKNQDGRFNAFVRFFVDPVVQPIDFSQVSPADSVLELDNQNLFLKCTVDSRVILLPDGTPYALVSLPSAIFQEAIDSTGDFRIILAVFGIPAPPNANDPILDIIKKSFVGVRVYPSCIYPDAFGIPLKSNLATYGPWYVIGAPGKTKVEQDSGLTPWNYGGEIALQLAATSRVATSLTNMQVSESGSMELAGLPSVSLGDVLAVDGPNLTNVGVSYGINGITTTYRFETFTPKWFASLSRGSAERIRKAAQSSQQLRKSLRQSLRKAVVEQAGFAARTAEQSGFMKNASKIAKRESPHDTFVSWSGQDENGKTRTLLSTSSYEEAISLANADDDNAFKNTAIMSFTGIVRPYSTLLGGSGLIPSLTAPSGVFPNAINSTTYNPIFAANDIEIYTWGNTYAGLNQRDRSASVDYSNSRGMALKGPLMVNGWGYDVNLNPVPGNGSGGFYPDMIHHSDKWRVGPVDLLWDPMLGTWCSRDIMTGKANLSILPGFSGSFNIESDVHGNLSNQNLTAYNYGNGVISSGQQSILYYSYRAGNWIASSSVASAGEKILRGVAASTLTAYGSGLVNCWDSPYGQKVVYNWFGSDVPAFKSVIIGYTDRQNQWNVLSSDC